MEMSFSAKQFAVGCDLDNSYSVATKELYVSLNLLKKLIAGIEQPVLEHIPTHACMWCAVAFT